MNMRMKSLTPDTCFFCGGRVKVWDTYDNRWKVECGKCKIRGPSKSTKDAAIKAWNDGNWIVLQCSKTIRRLIC